MITLRRAAEEDSERLFAWRNDPVTRANFKNTEVVPWQDHIRWLAGILKNLNSELWIAEVEGKPVGQIRFDVSNDTVELSWTIAPEERGKGYGTVLVSQAVRYRRWPLRKVLAEIKHENKASQRVAAYSGFERVEDRGALQAWILRDEPFIIAELSANHLGDLNRALRLIELAKQAGADAVKLQSYTADLITIDSHKPGFVIEKGPWAGRRLYDLYREAETPREWHAALFAKAREVGITCFSSAFDPDAVALLDQLGASAHKLASFEIVDLPLIKAMRESGLPIIISTGMAEEQEIEEALQAADGATVALLHCVSAYPARADEMNLRRIEYLRKRFNVPVGLSDHSTSNEAAIASTALGTKIIEKHLTIKRSDGGPDAAFSLEPDEFEGLVKAIRATSAALQYSKSAAEAEHKPLRRSLYAVENIAAGELLTEKNVRSVRPGFGLPPKMLPEVLGKKARVAIEKGTPLAADQFA